MHYANHSKTIICPQITCWVIFVLDFLSTLAIIYKFKDYIGLADTGFVLISAIFVTLGISFKNYRLYFYGLIISWVTSVLTFIYGIVKFILMDKEKIIKDYPEAGPTVIAIGFIIDIYFATGIIFIQSCILWGYNERVKNISENSQINQAQAPIQMIDDDTLV